LRTKKFAPDIREQIVRCILFGTPFSCSYRATEPAGHAQDEPQIYAPCLALSRLIRRLDTAVETFGERPEGLMWRRTGTNLAANSRLPSRSNKSSHWWSTGKPGRMASLSRRSATPRSAHLGRVARPRRLSRTRLCTLATCSGPPATAMSKPVIAAAFVALVAGGFGWQAHTTRPRFLRTIAWAATGIWLKAETHVHTGFSDGGPIHEVVDHAVANGCDVLAITDHTDSGLRAATPEYHAYRRDDGRRCSTASRPARCAGQDRPRAHRSSWRHRHSRPRTTSR
jgi:hypothetical protein